jgi:hypothetical protein
MRLISSPSMVGSSEAVEVCSILVRVLMFSLMQLTIGGCWSLYLPRMTAPPHLQGSKGEAVLLDV